MSEVDNEIKELNKQLYPTGRAWGYVHGSEQSGTEITNFVDGLGNPFVDGFGNAFIQTSGSEASPSKRLINAFLKSTERYYADLLSLLNEILADNDGFDETDASNWERVFGLLKGDLTIEERKTKILLRQGYPTGEIERSTAEFMQAELQANGFDVYVQENRFPDGAGGWLVQDPDLAATLPVQLGLVELGNFELDGDVTGLDYTIIANYIDELLDETYFDNVFQQNELGVAELGEFELGKFSPMTRDEELRFTFFIGGQSYPSAANIPVSRKDEFRQLVLKLKQNHNVAFLYSNFTQDPEIEFDGTKYGLLGYHPEFEVQNFEYEVEGTPDVYISVFFGHNNSEISSETSGHHIETGGTSKWYYDAGGFITFNGRLGPGQPVNLGENHIYKIRKYGTTYEFTIDGSSITTTVNDVIEYNNISANTIIGGRIESGQIGNLLEGRLKYVKFKELDVSGNIINDLVEILAENDNGTTVPNTAANAPASSDLTWFNG